MTRTALVQRQIVATAALVVGGLMLWAVLECVAHAQELGLTGIPPGILVSFLLFAGMAVLVANGLTRPSWVRVIWVVIATVYFSVWSFWPQISSSPKDRASKARVQLTIPSRERPSGGGFGGMGR